MEITQLDNKKKNKFLEIKQFKEHLRQCDVYQHLHCINQKEIEQKSLKLEKCI